MASKDTTRPNVLFILTDDQGYWAMNCAGNREIRTPSLDRLADSGIRFDNFFCTSPVCSPARASLLTGRIPSQHGVQDFLRGGNTPLVDRSGQVGTEGKGENPIEYLSGQTAYTDQLALKGYDCGLSGKWHLGASHIPQKSFTYWDVFATGRGPYYQSPMIRDGKLYRDPRYVSDLITDNAIDYLDGQKVEEAPFCLHVHYTAPHEPWGREEHPNDLWDDYYSNCSFSSVPDEPLHQQQLYKKDQMGTTQDMRRRVLAGYYAAVTAMDRNIGRLLDWLENAGLRENTLVFFTSDNGMSMGHHGIYGKGNGTFPPNMYDTAVKVPAIASQPGHIPEGRVCEALLSHYDWMPTLLDYVNVPNPDAEKLPGSSFAALFRDEAFDPNAHVIIYEEYGPTRMIRETDWKYIHRYPHGPHELYHLAQDPGEKTNLAKAAEHRHTMERLRATLEAWFVRYVDPARDGSHEAVMGRGQIDIVGPAALGRQRFGHDVIYARDVEE